MNLSLFSDTPFQLQLSFYRIIENLEKLALDETAEGSGAARRLLQELAAHPELRNGITDGAQITENADLISRLLADYFPAVLTHNEIKAVNIPYTEIFFNHSERLKSILRNAGDNFTINIRGFDEHQSYVMSCCIILNEYYGTRLDFGKPLFYDIPTADGITKHYRILYNADFLEIVPTEKAILLQQEDIDLLLNNYDNLALWKEKFPEESWILKGFAIITLFDATVENAVSILKEKLLGISAVGFHDSVQSIFRSIFRIPDIRVGFTLFDQEQGKFGIDSFGQQMESFILPDNTSRYPEEVLCPDAYSNLLLEKKYFSVSDTIELKAFETNSNLADRFLAQGINSFILAPVVKNKHLFGILEVVSLRAKELNSINANKLEVVMPFLTDTIERVDAELQNQVQAVIQDKFTAVHESVYWKFRAEAQRLIYSRQLDKEYQIKEIVFPDVYPLYGQVDIKGSSEARNLSVQRDLISQLEALLPVIEAMNGHAEYAGTFMDEILQLKDFLNELSEPIRANTEQQISNYIEYHIHFRLRKVADQELLLLIEQYFNDTNQMEGSFHVFRRKYETTIAAINDKMASIIDASQAEVQTSFPHYYERFKTDGVEHNLYVGQSISPTHEFTVKKLYDLRLWQLRVLCEMEIAHHQLKPNLPYPLDVTTLVLVHHSTIAIRFRMDEKRFDVDGSYNARFEIVKKRIDKAHIKGTDERITATGKITIVYSNEVEEQEYTGYIEILQVQGLLGAELEKIDIEDLQGISGLKALRVKIRN